MNVEMYNKLEKEAISRLPNRIIEASQSITFDRLGYPSRVSSTKELWKYADAMQEQRTRTNYDMLYGLTNREFELVTKVTEKTRQITKEHCDREVIPASSVLRAVLAYRAVEVLGKQSVLEIGPGSGYLGAMLIADGYDYHSVENSQGFHLWQSLLFGEKYQIYWWDYITKEPPKVDLYVANHVLNEMHPMALKYTLSKASDLFVIENFGGEIISTTNNTKSLIQSYGYSEAGYGAATLMYKGELPKYSAGLMVSNRWDDLLKLWGGSIPETEDEKFWSSI